MTLEARQNDRDVTSTVSMLDTTVFWTRRNASLQSGECARAAMSNLFLYNYLASTATLIGAASLLCTYKSHRLYLIDTINGLGGGLKLTMRISDSQR